MYNVLNEDIVRGPLREDGIPSYLMLSERVTKTRKGTGGQGIDITHSLMNFYDFTILMFQGLVMCCHNSTLMIRDPLDVG